MTLDKQKTLFGRILSGWPRQPHILEQFRLFDHSKFSGIICT